MYDVTAWELLVGFAVALALMAAEYLLSTKLKSP